MADKSVKNNIIIIKISLFLTNSVQINISLNTESYVLNFKLNQQDVIGQEKN